MELFDGKIKTIEKNDLISFFSFFFFQKLFFLIFWCLQCNQKSIFFLESFFSSNFPNKMHSPTSPPDEHRQSLMASDYTARPDAPRKPRGRDGSSLAARWQLWIAMIFCFMFMIGEVVGGYFAGSLAIMTE